MFISDGKGRGYNAEVNELNQLVIRAVVEQRPSYISRTLGQAYSVTAIDAGPTANEYTIWLQNNSDTPIVINNILTSNVAANAIWKLHTVSGTGSTAAVITPINLNLSSGIDSDVTCRGGAGGVDTLTSLGVITAWDGGVAYFNTEINTWLDALILGKNDAIAVEYDAGTSSAASVSIMYHNLI
jgi:hypothetical protein